jgi:hypothetical protein
MSIEGTFADNCFVSPNAGGFLTGVTELSTELSAKRLEFLRDVVPGLRVVAML